MSVGAIRQWASVACVAGLLAAGTGALGGCSAEDSDQPLITIKNSTFGGDLVVEVGAEVAVRNEDTVAHMLTALDDSFTSDSIDPGATGEFYAPSAPGEYPIGCSFHPSMSGRLIVVAPAPSSGAVGDRAGA